MNCGRQLWSSVGWKPRGRERWNEVLSKSSFVYSAWDGDRLIGVGRILEDGIMCMFYDIGVLPRYQSRGIGKAIVARLVDQVRGKNYASIGLFRWEENPGNEPFYEKFGFRGVPTGMELVELMQRE